MSYAIDHQWGGLRIAPDQEAQALWALAETLEGMAYDRESGAWHKVPYWDEGLVPFTLEQALDELGICKVDDETGYRLDDYDGPPSWDYGQHADVFCILATYAEEGQFVAFQGEDGERWGYHTLNHSCKTISARTVWSTDESYGRHIVWED